jgi:hypothetical protein
MLKFVVLAAVALAAGQPPTHSEARRCWAVLDVAWPEEQDEARKRELVAAAEDWGSVAEELYRNGAVGARQAVTETWYAVDRAEREWASEDPKVREGLLKEIEVCLAAKPERAA